ncbi:MAG: hypothetical protein GXZ02_10935 [Clostridiales bacterium]|nr:hypothetical protein [Clostridiales bacterium]
MAGGWDFPLRGINFESLSLSGAKNSCAVRRAPLKAQSLGDGFCVKEAQRSDIEKAGNPFGKPAFDLSAVCFFAPTGATTQKPKASEGVAMAFTTE